MGDSELREILAEEYEREYGPMHKSAEFIRLTKYRGIVTVDLAIAAMRSAVDRVISRHACRQTQE